jgi:hypothetical protein
MLVIGVGEPRRSGALSTRWMIRSVRPVCEHESAS